MIGKKIYLYKIYLKIILKETIFFLWKNISHNMVTNIGKMELYKIYLV